MKFVDRIEETERLKTALTRERASFVVLYGRRRLGKSTMLIQRVLEEGDVYFLADSSEGHHQRGLLAKV
ncbi:MAG: ATP-binding protein, partial [Bacteroidales bacterium]|nr:ATP-binding protein [Bacteroidales bacterium]